METINCTPTWLGLLPMLLQLHTQCDKAITKKNTPENRKNYDDVREELKNMAIAADQWNAHVAEEEAKAQQPKPEYVLYLSIPCYNGAVRVWEGEGTITEELQQGLSYKVFGTEEAKQEYLNGLFDASDGGDSYTILTEEQYKQIENWDEEDDSEETPLHLQNDKTN